MNLGLGVMINMFSDNSTSVEAYKKALNKKIELVVLDGDDLIFRFTDGYKCRFYDGGQSCCEHRYMTTDGENLDYYSGATFESIELQNADGPSQEYGDHDIQFLKVHTSKGTFDVSAHNEHNGYYGGFYIKCEATK